MIAFAHPQPSTRKDRISQSNHSTLELCENARKLSISINLSHLYKQIDHHLRRVSTQKLPPHFDKDDLRQNIYVAIIESLSNFDPNLSSQNTFQDRVIQKCIRKKLASFRWRKNMSECSLDDGTVDLPTQTSIRTIFRNRNTLCSRRKCKTSSPPCRTTCKRSAKCSCTTCRKKLQAN